MPAGGLGDAALLKRLRAIYSAVEVAVVEKRLAEVRQAIAEGRADAALAREVHERSTYRMHDLEVFHACRERFGARRKTGARAPRGRAAPAKGVLRSARDLRVRVE